MHFNIHSASFAFSIIFLASSDHDRSATCSCKHRTVPCNVPNHNSTEVKIRLQTAFVAIVNNSLIHTCFHSTLHYPCLYNASQSFHIHHMLVFLPLKSSEPSNGSRTLQSKKNKTNTNLKLIFFKIHVIHSQFLCTQVHRIYVLHALSSVYSFLKISPKTLNAT